MLIVQASECCGARPIPWAQGFIIIFVILSTFSVVAWFISSWVRVFGHDKHSLLVNIRTETRVGSQNTRVRVGKVNQGEGKDRTDAVEFRRKQQTLLTRVPQNDMRAARHACRCRFDAPERARLGIPAPPADRYACPRVVLVTDRVSRGVRVGRVAKYGSGRGVRPEPAPGSALRRQCKFRHMQHRVTVSHATVNSSGWSPKVELFCIVSSMLTE